MGAILNSNFAPLLYRLWYNKIMKRPKWKRNLAWKRVGSFFIIVDDSDEKSIHRLNVTSAFIWELCDGKHSLEDISKKLVSEYNINLIEALSDCSNQISVFFDKGLLDE